MVLCEFMGSNISVPHSLRTVVDEVKPAIKMANPTDGKLVIAEGIAEGLITWKSMKLYFSGYPLMFFSIWISVASQSDWVNTFHVWFLGY